MPSISHPDDQRAVVRTASREALAGATIGLAAGDAGVASAVATLAAGSPGVPPHLHHESSELFLVLDGRLDALLGDEILTLHPGDTFVAGPGVIHALAPAPGFHAVTFVVTTPPASRPDYYRLLDDLHRGEATGDQLLASQERFDSYFVDSPAWTDRAKAGDER